MPASFLDVVNYRRYLDRVYEAIGLHSRVSKPPDYVIHTPILFSRWEDWASKYYEATEEKEIRPLGQKIYPDWIRESFDGLEDFFQYYNALVEETREIEHG